MNYDKTRNFFQLKDPISWLNVLFPPPQNPRYISMGITGTLQKVEYSMVCCIQNWKFSEKGKSIFYFVMILLWIRSYFPGKTKKDAKLACSQLAIESICGLKISEMKTIPEMINMWTRLIAWMEENGKSPIPIINHLGIEHSKQFCFSKVGFLFYSHLKL